MTPTSPPFRRPRSRPLRTGTLRALLLAAPLLFGAPLLFPASPLLSATLAAQFPDTVSLERLLEARHPDSVYATPGLREFVTRAAEENRTLPDLLERYLGGAESEISIIQAEPDGREIVLQLEQVASELAWRRGEPPAQRVVGYRARTLGLVPSALAMFEVPWLVPTLYGDRIDLVRWSAPVRDEEGRVLRRRAVHPLGPGRDRVYRFSGGDTVVTLRVGDRSIPVARVHVTPVRDPDLPTLLFEGVLDLDATRHQIIRMRGRMIATDPDPTLEERLLGGAFTGATFVSFESAEYDGRFWLPRYQRMEVQAHSRLTDSRLALRVVSRFRHPDLNPTALPPWVPDEVPRGGILVMGDDVRERDFGEWTSEIGTLTRETNVQDFRDFFRDRGDPEEGLRVRFGARHLSHLVRYNDPEGLFTGVGGTAEGAPLPPAVRLRAHAGWAWSEETVRGGAAVTWAPEESRWEGVLQAERQIVDTRDFGGGYGGEPGVPPLVAGTDQVFHDRRTAGLVARQPRGGGLSWRFEVARAEDRRVGGVAALGLAEEGDPGSGDAGGGGTGSGEEDAGAEADLLAAAVTEGGYWIGRATLERNPGAAAVGVAPGSAFRLHAEGATGELEWVRLEAGASVGRVWGDVSLDVRLDGGAVLSSDPPPQRLFELGRYSGLAGFPPRAFTGDRAALGQGAVSYTLPILRRPLGGGGFYLPAIAPAPTVIVRAGWTDASDDALPVLERIGASPSDGVRTTLDLRMRFFGGGVSLGFARPLDSGGEWRFVWSLVAEF